MDFDPMSPIWLQIVKRLKGSIATGELRPGEKLPGSRDLALTYSINPNTAARVYQELERAGLCETRRGMGTYVTGDTERIVQLRTRMAADAAGRYLRDLANLGLSRADAIRLLNEREETVNA
uniref:Transcriptional regulator, GntR family n=1 Tax=uncultured bacterium Contig12 TaxID=1393397 RepID=W0FMR1_9BACT|nr:transcriptional regulator, GntR family [uncultured bacterium Contig12]